MSDTDVTLELPEREVTPRAPSRKTIYRSGVVNTFSFTRQGQQLEGYITFDAARLISLAARVQTGNDGTDRLVANLGIVLDNPVVGEVVGEQLIPHPLVSEKRYRAWQNSERPKRVNAQQWVSAENESLIRELANTLHASHGFGITRNPRKPENSQRTTQDIFTARPVGGMLTEDRTNYGVKLDAFEISVNPTYAPGFKSFVNGLDEQLKRWEDAYTLEERHRKAALEAIATNAHFLGGVHRDERSKDWWARPVDVGAVTIDGVTHALYAQRGRVLDEDLFAVAAPAEATAPAAGPSDAELEMPAV